MRLTKRTLTVGKRYRLGNKTFRCIRSTAKGINLVDEKRHHTIRSRSFYDSRWSNKHVPNNVRSFTVVVSPWLAGIQEIKS